MTLPSSASGVTDCLWLTETTFQISRAKPNAAKPTPASQGSVVAPMTATPEPTATWSASRGGGGSDR